MKETYEKLGLFYLGKDIDKQTHELTQVLTLLKNKNFTTHAAIIGMTGSGKTGLGVGLIEEAAIDNIPAIVIDPKGDMGNLCLCDPTFSPDRFEPWVKDEAEAKGESPFDYARKIATMWREGIESWGQSVKRAERFASVEKRIYTPGSSAGVPINVLSSLEVPPEEILQESDLFASYLKTTTVSLLTLAGIGAYALDDPEYILTAQILSKAWIAGEDMSIEKLIAAIIAPSFDRIGVLSLEDFYPQEKRFKLATKFNALLANPAFAQWMQGESLDIQNLLYDEEGRAKISIFSIGHLNDEERMFFVTLLLNRYIAWMRRQSGTTRLRTLLYMDEIFGFFPPSKNPPSKEPMLLLLKQARAFGVGIVLSTQNPVDLDYKGLSNIGTWFVGRLQTKQDIDRVIEGLSGKSNESFDKQEIRTLLSNLPKRTFFLKSAHLETIRLFGTRWVLSYLKGPLKRNEIAALSAPFKRTDEIREPLARRHAASARSVIPSVDSSVKQFYEPDPSEGKRYYPSLGAKVTLHFFSQRRGIDTNRELRFLLDLDSAHNDMDWSEAYEVDEVFEKFPRKAPHDASFEALPQVVSEDKGLKRSVRALKEHLYRTRYMTVWKCDSPKLESSPDESRADFMIRLEDLLVSQKEEAIEKLQERYEKREKTLLKRLQRAQERVEKEEADATNSMIEAGISILGALFGRSSVTKIGRAVNKGGKILKERGEMSRAQERVASVELELEDLAQELEDKIDQLSLKYDIENCEIKEVKIKAKKSDIDVSLCAIVWRI